MIAARTFIGTPLIIFQELESKVLSNTPVLDDSIGKGSEIYDSVSQANQEKIKTVVDAFTNKKTTLQENLETARKMYVLKQNNILIRC